MSSPKFFPRGWEVLPLLGSARRRRAAYENFAKNVAGAGEKLALFHPENEVYLVKIAFASENLEKFSPPAGYFSVQHH